MPRAAPTRSSSYDLFADEFALSCLNRLQLRNNQQMVDLADPAGALQLVGTLRQPAARADVTSLRRMLQSVLELGGEPAVSVGDRGLSYGELREAAAAVAEQFDGAERVAVWAESTLETCVAVVAAIATGAPLVPINPKLGRGELEHVLTDSKPDVVFGGPDGLDGRRRRPRRRAARPPTPATRTRR